MKIIRDNFGKFCKGSCVCGNSGKKHSNEAKLKMSSANKNKHYSLKTEFKRGMHASSETQFKKGCVSWNKGKKLPQLSGEKNPNWRGGKSFEPYSLNFNNEFKNLVRLRDNFCCINCGISEQKYIILFNQKLHIHHIDYNKKNTCLQNCCTLCIYCNSKANKNRNEWINYFQDLLSKKYGYLYNQEIILNFKKEVNND